jgi:hypothetical protein
VSQICISMTDFCTIIAVLQHVITTPYHMSINRPYWRRKATAILLSFGPLK